MSEFAPAKVPFVERASVLKQLLAHHAEFRTDLFASLTLCEPSSRLPEFGITECRQVGDSQWLVKTELNNWYSVTLDAHSTRIIKPYFFRPLTTKHEIDHMMKSALRFAKQAENAR